MCAFKFRLEPVVSLKKKLEDERKTALASAKLDLRQKEGLLVNLCGEKAECQNSLGMVPTQGNLDISQRLIYYAYIERLADEITNGELAVERSKQEVESRRGQLLESSREKKILEKLRQRMKDRHMARTRKAEQASLDETAGQRHQRIDGRGLVWKKE
jgi:flagellar FliJ protein